MASFGLVPGGGGHNYTGVLTRSIVFSGALLAFLAGKPYLAFAGTNHDQRDGLTMH
jgi:hypothetical protein